MRPRHRKIGSRLRVGIVVGLVLAMGTLGVASAPGTSATASTPASSPAARAAAPLQLADLALARANRQLRADHPRRGLRALRTLRVQVRRANVAAAGLIGKPPADPESDDPPGPPAVLAALGLDHRVGKTLVPLYVRRPGVRVASALRACLNVTQRRRVALLTKVIALPAEGAGSDYADEMSDTLGQYPNELSQLDRALATYRLRASARRTLVRVRSRIVVAKAKVDSAYGGGE